MKKYSPSIPLLILIVIISSCSKLKLEKQQFVYKPDSPELYREIMQMDSIFFTAYNNCDMETQARMYSDSIEFYHDQGGLMTSKQELLDGTRKNICGKVSRQLVKGSVEVYPINNYGAIEMGLHCFHNRMEKQNPQPQPSRFVIVWQKTAEGWKLRRVISLH